MNNEKYLDILILSDNGLETVGGEQESTKIIIENLKGSFSIGVIQPGKTEHYEQDVELYKLTFHTRIRHLIKHPFSFLKYVLKTKNIINKKKPGVIHTQAQVSFFIISLLKKLKFISQDIYFIHTERGLFTKYNSLTKKIFYFFIKELDTLVTTTEFNMKFWKKSLEERGFELNYKIIENTAGKLFEEYDSNFKKEDEDSCVIGFAGRYCGWKNWPLAVEISKELNNTLGEKLKVKMAVGCLDDKSLADTRAMFRKLKNILGNRFDGNINIDIQAMSKFYNNLDFFILTSNYNTESFGRTLIEAMSKKTVVLTTNAGGSVEVVGNNDNVCETVNEFTDRILYFYGNKNLLELEKENNLKRVNDHYSLSNNVEKHNKMYREII